MKDIEKKVIANAVRMLESIKVEYAIYLPNGEMLGSLKLKNAKRQSRYEYGSLTEHCLSYLKDAPKGEIISIPVAEFDHDRIQSTLCNLVRDKYGSGSYTTSRSKDSVDLLLYVGEET